MKTLKNLNTVDRLAFHSAVLIAFLLGMLIVGSASAQTFWGLDVAEHDRKDLAHWPYNDMVGARQVPAMTGCTFSVIRFYPDSKVYEFTEMWEVSGTAAEKYEDALAYITEVLDEPAYSFASEDYGNSIDTEELLSLYANDECLEAGWFFVTDYGFNSITLTLTSKGVALKVTPVFGGIKQEHGMFRFARLKTLNAAYP